MTKTFADIIDGIRTAILGIEVREDIAQGMEYVEQFAETSTTKAQEAAESATAAEQAKADTLAAKTEAVQAISAEKQAGLDAISTAKSNAVKETQSAHTAALQDISNARAGALDDVAASTKMATDAASTAAQKAGEASTNAADAQQAKTNAEAAATAAGKSQTAAETAQEKAEAAAELAGTRAGTDKTFTVEDAPADAKAVGDALKNLNIRPATSTTLGGIKVGSGLSVTDDGTLSADAQEYTLPVATATTLGLVKVGENLSVEEDGTLNGVEGGYSKDEIDSKLQRLERMMNMDGKLVFSGAGVCTGGTTTMAIPSTVDYAEIVSAIPAMGRSGVGWSSSGCQTATSNAIGAASDFGHAKVVRGCSAAVPITSLTMMNDGKLGDSNYFHAKIESTSVSMVSVAFASDGTLSVSGGSSGSQFVVYGYQYL